MGIWGFERFLKAYQDRLLTSYNVHDQYIIMDGSEIKFYLYADVERNGRGNYVEYRENIKKFFDTLQDCGIKPIILFDGFKFKANTSYYVEKQNKIIGNLRNAMKESSDIFIKPLLCNPVFKQTIEELKVPHVHLRKDADEDLAALSDILNAPVFANDTEFSVYSLQNGFIKLQTFEWKNPQIIQGKKSIKARIFRVKTFLEIFQVNKEALHFLAILLQQRDSQKFKNFRNTFLKNVYVPSHLRFLHMQRYRQHSVENCLIWLVQNQHRSTEDIIRLMLRSLSREVDVEEVRKNIIANLQKYRDPQIKSEVLREICEKISDDADCRSMLEANIEKFQNKEDHVDTMNPLEQNVSDECKNDELQQKQSKPWDVYLTIIPTDPTRYESPHKASASIRKASYSFFVKPPHDVLTVKEYDRVGLQYAKTQEFTVNRSLEDFNIFNSEEPEDDDIIEKRRSFLLEVLIEDEEHRNRFQNDINTINDDLKLTLATTIYWIKQTNPDVDVVEAFVFLFTVIQLKQSDVKDHIDSLLRFIEEKANEIQAEQIDIFPILHCSAQWEACLKESIYLNRTLKYPFPFPIIGRLFSGSILEQIYAVAIFDRDEVQARLKEVEGAQVLEKKIIDILIKVA